MKGMKVTWHVAATAAALLAAGTASAAPIGPNSLFFTAVDTTNNTSILVNLNKTSADLVANPSTPFGMTSSGLTGLTTWLAGADRNNVFWNVVGVLDDGSGAGFTPTTNYGGITTSKSIATNEKTWGLFGGLSSFVGDANNFVAANNTPATNDSRTASGNALVFVSALGFTQFPADFGSVGETLNAYQFFASQTSPLFEGDYVQLGGFSLAFANGLASFGYTGTGGGTEVPLPAAAWLLISSLVGLGAVGRRRRALAA